MSKNFIKPWQLDLRTSEQNIKQHHADISEMLKSEGLDKVQIKFGWEIEFTKIINNPESVAARKSELLTRDPKIMDYDHKYLPEVSGHQNLDTQFDIRVRNSEGQPQVGSPDRTIIKPEPAFKDNISSEVLNGKEQEVALAQNEVVSVPLSALGSAKWINHLTDKIIKDAEKFGIDRVDFSAKPSENTLINGLHCHASVFAIENNVKTNLLREQKTLAENEAPMPSELALCIAKKRNEFMEVGIIIFAPLESSYERYKGPIIGGPTYNGFGDKKSVFEMPSAMFRGDGKLSSIRPLLDEGAFRIEERMMSNEALGHPNKSAYPAQNTMPYEVVEAEMLILKEGVKLWKQRQTDRESGVEVKPLTYKDLLEDKTPIISNKEDAREKFTSSDAMKKAFGEDRMQRMLQRHDQFEKVNLKREAVLQI